MVTPQQRPEGKTPNAQQEAQSILDSLPPGVARKLILIEMFKTALSPAAAQT